MDHYSAIRKYEILQCVAEWIELEDDMLSEVSQKVKDDLTHTRNLEKQRKGLDNSLQTNPET